MLVAMIVIFGHGYLYLSVGVDMGLTYVDRVRNSHGYIHCMPYGKLSFVMRLSPRQPGYVMMVCAAASVETATVRIIEESILLVRVCVCVV